jgi:hypothetical protein
MSQLSPVLRDTSDNKLLFWCPACDRAHAICRSLWTWNGDVEKPTFSPSVLVSYNGNDAGIDGAPHRTCHSFVTDGMIQFLGDCTHLLAGKTVPLSEWP